MKFNEEGAALSGKPESGAVRSAWPAASTCGQRERPEQMPPPEPLQGRV